MPKAVVFHTPNAVNIASSNRSVVIDKNILNLKESGTVEINHKKIHFTKNDTLETIATKLSNNGFQTEITDDGRLMVSINQRTLTIIDHKGILKMPLLNKQIGTEEACLIQIVGNKGQNIAIKYFGKGYAQPKTHDRIHEKNKTTLSQNRSHNRKTPSVNTYDADYDTVEDNTDDQLSIISDGAEMHDDHSNTGSDHKKLKSPVTDTDSGHPISKRPQDRVQAPAIHRPSEKPSELLDDTVASRPVQPNPITPPPNYPRPFSESKQVKSSLIQQHVVNNSGGIHNLNEIPDPSTSPQNEDDTSSVAGLEQHDNSDSTSVHSSSSTVSAAEPTPGHTPDENQHIRRGSDSSVGSYATNPLHALSERSNSVSNLDEWFDGMDQHSLQSVPNNIINDDVDEASASVNNNDDDEFDQWLQSMGLDPVNIPHLSHNDEEFDKFLTNRGIFLHPSQSRNATSNAAYFPVPNGNANRHMSNPSTPTSDDPLAPGATPSEAAESESDFGSVPFAAYNQGSLDPFNHAEGASVTNTETSSEASSDAAFFANPVASNFSLGSSANASAPSASAHVAPSSTPAPAPNTISSTTTAPTVIPAAAPTTKPAPVSPSSTSASTSTPAPSSGLAVAQTSSASAAAPDPTAVPAQIVAQPGSAPNNGYSNALTR